MTETPAPPPALQALAPTEQSPAARMSDGRFGPGNPGRRPGSYGRVSRRAAMAILGHFEVNEDEMLRRLAGDLALYFKVLGRVLPRQIEVCAPDPESWSEAEAARAFAEARVVIHTQEGDRRRAMAMLESLLLDRPDHRPGPAINGG